MFSVEKDTLSGLYSSSVSEQAGQTEAGKEPLWLGS
jgi:hypothetical protein